MTRILRDEEAEERAAGAMIYYGLHDRPKYAELDARLGPDMITEPLLRAVVAGVRESMSRFSTVDPGVLLKHAKACSERGASTVAGLITSYNSPSLLGSIDYYTSRLRDLARLRGISDAIRGAVGVLGKSDSTSTDVMDNLQSALVRADQAGMGTQASVTAAQVGAEALQAWEDLRSGRERGLPTGLSKMDEVIGGLLPGQLILIAGRTSEGKSALMQQIADGLGLCGRQVLYVNLEMEPYELWARHLSQQAGTDLRGMMRGKGGDGWSTIPDERLQQFTRAYQASGLRYLNASTIRVSEIAAEARRLALTSGLDMLVVDYIQLLTPETRSESREREVAQSARSLKALARELHIPVVVAAQLNRKAVQDGDEPKDPELHHLRESGALEQDADVCVLIHRLGKDTGNTLLRVGKNRNGERNVGIKANFKGSTATFHEGFLIEDDERDGDRGKPRQSPDKLLPNF